MRRRPRLVPAGNRHRVFYVSCRIRRKVSLALIRQGLAAISLVSTALSACCAELVFRTPPRQRRTRRERAILAAATFEAIRGDSGEIATWRWGSGPVVLLVHGWGGHAGRLVRYVDFLTAAGFSVVAFDAPGHGLSAGRQVQLPEIARSILAVGARFGPLAGVVAHSLGAAATVWAMRSGLRVDRSVFLAPPANLEDLTRRFGHLLRLSSGITESMKKRLTERYRFCWSEYHVALWAHAMSSPLLVFHDQGDSKVPLADATAIARAWPGGRLVLTRGLGHHKILRAPDVIHTAVAFLAEARESSKLSPQRQLAAG
jgi:pimeloyl-ACP methyl ester carboxylesterase